LIEQRAADLADSIAILEIHNFYCNPRLAIAFSHNLLARLPAISYLHARSLELAVQLFEVSHYCELDEHRRRAVPCFSPWTAPGCSMFFTMDRCTARRELAHWIARTAVSSGWASANSALGYCA
jgi:hypothetical protein